MRKPIETEGTWNPWERTKCSTETKRIRNPFPSAATPLSAERPQFDISKQIRFAPPFQEKEVDKYFFHEWVRFFILVGLPKSLHSEQSSNFMSGLLQQVMDQLGIKQYRLSAYHPESQGALECFHQTLKNMVRDYGFENGRNWDEGVPLVLFAAGGAVQESLGFSPIEH